MNAASSAGTPPAPVPTDATAAPEQRVTPLELFFDLVFVFAITQVTGYLSADPSWTRLLEGLAILTVLWWAWGCYAWLGNTAGSDDGLFRVVLLTAMAAMLIAAVAVPHAFGADALTFGIAYAAVRVLHIVAYALMARGDPTLRHAVNGLARSMVPVGLLLLLAGIFDGEVRTACWILALAVDLGGLWLFGVEGWRVEAAHLAERYGLIIIIALGESIVALGVGAEEHDLDAALIAAILLGIATAAALWWAYFDVVALVAARRFRQTSGRAQVLMARDSYTYLHAPMVAGIILFAFGAKVTLAHTGDELDAVPAVGLCGGLALYFLGHVAFRLRNVHTLNRGRLAAAIAFVALIPVATAIPALASLAVVAAICVGLIAYEFVHFHEARERMRRAPA